MSKHCVSGVDVVGTPDSGADRRLGERLTELDHSFFNLFLRDCRLKDLTLWNSAFAIP